MGDIKHMTCQTEKGFRRSPLSDISYNCGQKLTDEFTKRTHNRKHYDGTQIIDSDIVSADESCIYGDSSIKSDKRRNMMYNDLYRLNKKNSERIYWKTEIALPNNMTDEQLKETAKEIALSFSQYLRRPVDYSIHKKPPKKTKPGNNHVHIAVPERVFDNGKWSGKSTSYYIDMEGNLIYDKIYKDEQGNDIRKPCTIDNEEPIYAINPETGLKYYVNQRKDKNGRLQWKNKDINALGKSDLKWMHNEIDRIQNMVLSNHKINDQVKRNDSRTTTALKEAGIKAQHIGKRDAEKKGESYQEKIEQNQQYEFFKNVFDNKFANLDEKEREFYAAERAEVQAEKSCAAITIEKEKKIQEANNLQNEVNVAITDYIENELQPEEIFVKDSISEFNKAIDLVKQNTDPIITTMNNGISAINEKINKFNSQENPTDRERLLIDYIASNGYHMERYGNAAYEIFRKSLSSEKIQAASRKRWRKYRGWLTRNYIHKVVGKEAAFLYEKYLRLKNIIKPEEQNPKKHIGPVTMEFALTSIINGGSVPNIKSRIRNDQTITNNAVRITAETNTQFNKDAQSENHLPPPTAEPLILWNTLPNRILQLTNEEKRVFYNPLPDYQPQKDQQVFQDKLTEMDTLAFQAVTHQQNDLTQTKESLNRISNIINIINEHIADRRAAEQERIRKEEADRRAAWSREEYDRLAAIAKNDLEAYRSAVVKHVAENEYKEKLAAYNAYKEIKEPVDAAYQKWQDVRDAEIEEARRKTEQSHFFDYEPNQSRIDYYESLYDQEKRIFDSYVKRYFPDGTPKEPNLEYIKNTAWQKYGKRQANLLIKDSKDMFFANKETLLAAYLKSAAARNNYWKNKPDDDPAAGKPTQQKTADRRANTTPTLANPDRKKGKDRYTGR